MKKKRVLKKWVVNVLGWVLGGWIFFCCTTIESIGNPIYDRILSIWTLFAILSFYLLDKYSTAFEYHEED